LNQTLVTCRLLGGGPDFIPDWSKCCDHFALHAGKTV